MQLLKQIKKTSIQLNCNVTIIIKILNCNIINKISITAKIMEIHTKIMGIQFSLEQA